MIYRSIDEESSEFETRIRSSLVGMKGTCKNDRSIDSLPVFSSLFTHSPFKYLNTLQAPPYAPHLPYDLLYLVSSFLSIFFYLFFFSSFRLGLASSDDRLHASMFHRGRSFIFARLLGAHFSSRLQFMFLFVSLRRTVATTLSEQFYPRTALYFYCLNSYENSGNNDASKCVAENCSTVLN